MRLKLSTTLLKLILVMSYCRRLKKIWRKSSAVFFRCRNAALPVCLFAKTPLAVSFPVWCMYQESDTTPSCAKKRKRYSSIHLVLPVKSNSPRFSQNLCMQERTISPGSKTTMRNLTWRKSNRISLSWPKPGTTGCRQPCLQPMAKQRQNPLNATMSMRSHARIQSITYRLQLW